MHQNQRKKRVLILCTGNSCRSQMAEGLWRALAGDEWEVFSAGSKPAGYVHPLAVAVMHEIGIDTSSQASKHVGTFASESFDLVITVCDGARESCPVFPQAASMLHWSFEDPALIKGSPETKTSVFRQIRDQIMRHIEQFLSCVNAE